MLPTLEGKLGRGQVNLRSAAFFINYPIQVDFSDHSLFIVVGMTGFSEPRAAIYLLFAEHGLSASAYAISVKLY
jgi:hypothetical protein